ncbi:hypothetical protein H4F36_23910, partial [Escherichia coli]|nr:hypothetical protein [Escherichia coli]
KCEEECNVLPFPHGDCDKYWKCDGNQAVLVVCSEGLHFNPSTHTCDFACNVGCVRETIQTTSGPDGVRIYLPWSQVNSKTSELLKLIAH